MSDALVAWVAEALDGIAAVTSRRMFGGVSLYADGRIFAIIADDALWFKCDAISDPEWDAEGAPRFTFYFGLKADGAPKMAGKMNYRRVPDVAYDDADSLRHWAELARAASARMPLKKRAKPREAVK